MKKLYRCMYFSLIAYLMMSSDLGAQSISGTIQLVDGTPVQNVMVDLSGGAVSNDLTDINGDYEFPGLTNGLDYTVVPSLDANCPDCVNVTDVIAVRNHILAVSILDPYQIYAADVNNSLGVTTLDMVIMLQMILGTITAWPAVPCYRFMPENYIFPDPNPFTQTIPNFINVINLSGNVNADFFAIKSGNVAGPCPTVLSSPLTTVIIDFNSANCDVETITVPVKVEDFLNILGIQFSIAWDPTVLSYNTVSNLNLPSLNSSNFGIANTGSGILTFAYVDFNLAGQTLPDGSIIFDIIFDVVGSPGDITGIDITNAPTDAFSIDTQNLESALNTQNGQFQILSGGPTNVACNDMLTFALDEDCLAEATPEIVLEGSFGCLTADDFVVTVQDGDQSNGGIIDGPGSFVYVVTLAPGVDSDFTSCFGNIDAVDVLPPTITCPPDEVVVVPTGTPSAVVNGIAPIVTDNCGTNVAYTLTGATTGNGPDDASGNAFNVGITTVTYTVVDSGSNSATCTFTVTVLEEGTNDCEAIGLAVTPVDLENNNCCWSLSYDINTMQFGGVGITVLGGAQIDYDPDADIIPGLQDINFSETGLILAPVGGGPLPGGDLINFFTFCLSHITSSPQLVLVEWYDLQFNVVCEETFTFECEPEPDCLYILSDTLYCDTAGYKYEVLVKNPLGSNFDVGRIKLNVLSPGGIQVLPDYVVDLMPPLEPGESTTITFCIDSYGQNLAGEEFCFILSAHEGPDELLCCSEIEKCMELPQCDPCEAVSAEAIPITESEDCCFEFWLTNTWKPGYFTALETKILTPGVSFTSVQQTLPTQWIRNDIVSNQHYLWTHGTGYLPLMNPEKLMDFCIEGSTTTDSVYIEIKWLQEDSVICKDTLGLYCPECLVIDSYELYCEDGDYKYEFTFQNLNDQGYDVNVIEVIEPTGNLMPEGYIYLSTPVSVGNISEVITLMIDGSAGPGEFCFDIVLRNVIADSINVECCYVTHCIDLPDCGIPCEELFCVPPADVTVDCDVLPPGFDPLDIGLLESLFGTAEAQGDCPNAFITELPPQDNLSDCGFGTLIRTFEANDGFGNTTTCQQVILVNETHHYEIRFPADEEVLCENFSFEPDVFYDEIGCELIAISHTDELFIGETGCYEIFRTISVINWCEFDGNGNPVIIGRDEDCDGNQGDEDIWVLVRPNGEVYLDRDNAEFNLNPTQFTKSVSCDGLTNPNGHWISTSIDQNATPPRDISSVGYWQYTQVITIIDNTDPLISVDPYDVFCVFDEFNCTADVEISFTLADNCNVDYLIIDAFLDVGITDVDNSGTIDENDFTTDFDLNSGVFSLNGSYPNYSLNAGGLLIGNHAFFITLEDICGNETTVFIPFSVIDCLIDPLTCINGLAAELQEVNPPADVDGDGDLDAGAILVFPIDFLIQPPVTTCGSTVSLSINKVGETPDIAQTSLFLTCDDLGNLAVEIHVWDIAGNNDYCETFVVIQDGNGYCSVLATPGETTLMYPIPARSELMVIPKLSQTYDIQIIMPDGKTVLQQKASPDDQGQIELPVNQLIPGLYLLQLKGADGTIENHKFIKM